MRLLGADKGGRFNGKCTPSVVFNYMGVSKNCGTPKWMVKIMENPVRNGMIWGENPLFLETPHICVFLFFWEMVQFDKH